MTENQIKQKKTESLLKELVAEAIGSLADDNINKLTVTGISCSRGKYDSTIYFDKSDYSQKEQYSK